MNNLKSKVQSSRQIFCLTLSPSLIRFVPLVLFSSLRYEHGIHLLDGFAFRWQSDVLGSLPPQLTYLFEIPLGLALRLQLG